MASKRNRVDIDRISSLPDDVLCHILSFVPTKYSVRTRILSTRWNYLYASVPILDFDYSLSMDDEKLFLKFVDRVLLFHNSQRITKFRFNYKGGSLEETDFTKWVSSAVHRSVQEIDIIVSFHFKPCLPCCLFTCKTLITLKLEGKYDLSIPVSACLPCLKTLNIRNVDESVQTLFSICPMLEDLLISNCVVLGNGVFNISVPTLKRLRIDSSDLSSSWLLLNVPSLERFDFVNSPVYEVIGETLKSLDQAFISPRIDILRSQDLQLSNLVKMVSFAQHLFLSTITTDFVFQLAKEQAYRARTEFQNLTHLELGRISSPLSKFCSLLPTWLSQCFINLEVLVFTDGFEKENVWSERKNHFLTTICLPPHLKEIQFKNFLMMPSECFLVKHFLENAGGLDKMVIQPHLSFGKQVEMRNMLKTFSRNSRTCQIVIE